MIPHSRPCVGEAEARAASRVVRSGMLAQGAEVAGLEEELAERIGVPYTVAASSGTASLHLSLAALGTGSQHEVIFPSYVCSALLHATWQTGAAPRVTDIGHTGFNTDSATLAGAVSPHTKAAILPHMFGCLVQKTSLPAHVSVVEDCAMALGATGNSGAAGSFGDLSVFSFYATKVICGAEGGAIAVRDEGLAEVLRDLRDYDGRSADRPRYSYKLSDLHAAVARIQLGRLEEFVERRCELGRAYSRRLRQTSALLPSFADGEFPYRYVIRVADADRTIAQFEARQVCARKPVFEPCHRAAGASDIDYPGTIRAQREAVSIPLYPDLSASEIEHILRSSEEVL